MSTSSTSNIDVLIVGAGPTGLVLALWLMQMGVRVRVVDEAAQPGTTSRALAVQARTLELYRQVGLADAVVARGRRVTELTVAAQVNRRNLVNEASDEVQYLFAGSCVGPPMRITIVSDSHLAPAAPACNANWRAVREYIARSASDLTVHLGDITLDAASDSSQLDVARAMCEPWPTMFRFLPGNHDVGDNPPGPKHPAQQPVERELLENFRTRFGPDYWSMAIDGWFVLGLNAQLFGGDFALQTDQWRWLCECVREAGRRPVALMLHKPLFQHTCEDVVPHIRYVPLAPRRRLLNLVAGLNLQIVLSGHVHQYLDRIIEGVRHVWVPSTAFYLPDSIQERVGEKVTGLGLLELSSTGCRFDLVCPDGVAHNNLVEQPFYSALK